MKLHYVIQSIIILFISAWSYEIPDEEEYVTQTYSLSVKVQVIPDKEMEKPTGRAKDVAHLCDSDGDPHSGETLHLTATAGTFICKLPEEATKEEKETTTDCFTTGADGKATVYLVNIPLNRQVHVKAIYDSDDYTVTGNAKLLITRGKVKKRKQVRPGK
jgi:hypothetical protein